LAFLRDESQLLGDLLQKFCRGSPKLVTSCRACSGLFNYKAAYVGLQKVYVQKGLAHSGIYAITPRMQLI
jgi:hypothetical protein